MKRRIGERRRGATKKQRVEPDHVIRSYDYRPDALVFNGNAVGIQVCVRDGVAEAIVLTCGMSVELNALADDVAQLRDRINEYLAQA